MFPACFILLHEQFLSALYWGDKLREFQQACSHFVVRWVINTWCIAAVLTGENAGGRWATQLSCTVGARLDCLTSVVLVGLLPKHRVRVLQPLRCGWNFVSSRRFLLPQFSEVHVVLLVLV